MNPPPNQPGSRSPLLALSLLGASLLLAGIGAIVMTDAGQVLGVSKGVIVAYFQNHRWIMGASVVFFVVAALVDRRAAVLRGWRFWASLVVILGCFATTKYVVPYVMFPSQHRGAEYVTIAEAPAALEPDDVVYVLDRGGVARAYPRETIWQPHIFGGDFGGEDVVFTYCVMTNLPVAYRNELAGEPMDLRVLAQTNNNLLLWDTNSGEIIQQITSTAEFSHEQLDPLPVTLMTWRAYQQLHPEGEVLEHEFRGPVAMGIAWAMPLEDAHHGEEWMFPTVATDDQRLPAKEHVVGLRIADDSVAYTREHLEQQGVLNTEVGGVPVAIAHVPLAGHPEDPGLIAAFDRRVGDEVVEVTEIDAFGNTPEQGRLARVVHFDGVLWAVWLHYFPDTRLVR